MKTRFLILIAITVLPLFSYASGQNQIIEIGIDQTIQLDDFKLYFYDIEDSRCPLDVTCVWEGKVTAMINLDNKTLDASTYFTPGLTVTFPPYEITMTDIRPHPVSTEKPDYVATLELSRIQEFTDEQICGKGNKLVDGVCMPLKQPQFSLDCAPWQIYNSNSNTCDIRLNSIYVFAILAIIAIIVASVTSIIIWRKRK